MRGWVLNTITHGSNGRVNQSGSFFQTALNCRVRGINRLGQHLSAGPPAHTSGKLHRNCIRELFPHG